MHLFYEGNNVSVMPKRLDEYLKWSAEEESLPYFHIITEEDFIILPLLILSLYLKGIEEFSLKFDIVPTVSRFEKISNVVSLLPGLEITYIQIKEIFIKNIANREEIDLSKVDQSWIKLLLETIEYVLQNCSKKNSNSNKIQSYFNQYKTRAEKLFLKGNLEGHSKLFVKLILENILNIISEVWNDSQQLEKE